MEPLRVVDNNSKDRTSSIAKSFGATVIFEPKQGKGNAVKAGFLAVDPSANYVVMLDGDNTYKATEIPRLIEPIESGFADFILGSRLSGHVKHGSMTFSHRLANWFFTFLIRQFYKANVTDVCTGFFAWRADLTKILSREITSSGFAIETEMVTKMARMRYKIYSVPITYDCREGHSKISPLRDGLKILSMIIRNFRWSPTDHQTTTEIRDI